MLYTIPKISSHISYRLNRNLIFFFSKLRRINEKSTFNPKELFANDFATFLLTDKQETLRKLFVDFFQAFQQLPYHEKTSTINVFCDSQKISFLLNNDHIDVTALKVSMLEVSIVEPTKKLFQYLFSTTLNSFGKLSSHYKQIFDSLESNVCPFCGIELLNKPSIIRQDYDHLLKQSEYIFCAVNMDNLVPTGVECNRINKHAVDVLYFNNVRTVFNSPYLSSYKIQVNLDGSIPPKLLDEEGQWIININPINDYTKQWAYVYNIKTRYAENFLHKFYKNWIKEMRTYLRYINVVPISAATLEKELNAQSVTMITHPTTSLGNIVKGAFFKFLVEYKDSDYRSSLLEYINN